MGLILSVVVHSANIQDRDGAKLVFFKIRHCFATLQLIWADAGYRGKLMGWVRHYIDKALEIVEKQEGQTGFVVLPKRWVVERTFGWLNRSRRLSKAYEAVVASSEAWVYISMIRLMLPRLTGD